MRRLAKLLAEPARYVTAVSEGKLVDETGNSGGKNRRIVAPGARALRALLASPWLWISALVAALNAPLLAHLATHVVGSPGDDAFEVLWIVDWTRESLFERRASPLVAPDVFWPEGWHLAGSSQPLWWIVLLAPLAELLGSTSAYNLALLATFVVLGVGAYRLAREVTADPIAAAVGALALVVAPVLTMRKAGHLNVLLGSAALPWLALHARRALLGPPQARVRAAVRAGVALGASALGHWQFVFVAPLVPLALAIAAPSSAASGARRAATLALIAVIGAATAAPAAWLTFRARAASGQTSAAIPVTESDRYSMSLDRILVPSPLHPLYGEASRRRFPVDSEAGAVSAGYAVLALAAVGAFTARRSGRPFVLLAALAIVLAMGTTLHLNGRPVAVPLPESVAVSVNRAAGGLLDPLLADATDRSPLPLPAAVLRHVVPGATALRAWNRFWIAGMFAVSVLAAMGLQALRRGMPRGAGWLALGLAAIVLFEGLDAPYPAFSAANVNERSADSWLRTIEPRPAVVEYPLPEANLGALDSQRRHRARLANGVQWLAPPAWRRLHDLGRWPSAESVALLREMGVRFVLASTRRDAEGDRVLAALASVAELRHVRAFAGAWPGFDRVDVFEIEP
jgi:hypothetical protein